MNFVYCLRQQELLKIFEILFSFEMRLKIQQVCLLNLFIYAERKLKFDSIMKLFTLNETCYVLGALIP